MYTSPFYNDLKIEQPSEENTSNKVDANGIGLTKNHIEQLKI